MDNVVENGEKGWVNSMKKYGLFITDYHSFDFLRFNTDEEAENAYTEYKSKGYGVVKVKIEKDYGFFSNDISHP